MILLHISELVHGTFLFFVLVSSRSCACAERWWVGGRRGAWMGVSADLSSGSLLWRDATSLGPAERGRGGGGDGASRTPILLLSLT